MNDVDVLVIGGGISGLSTAWWLNRAGLDVEVWEGADRLGGKIRSQRRGGYLTERAASLVMNFRPEVTELIGQAGLESAKRRRAGAARRYMVRNGRLSAVPMALSGMLLSNHWSLRSKLRLLAEPFVPPGGGDDESVSAFVTRRLGREMLETAIEPFVAGTLAADPELACASATLPRLTALERRYGSIGAGVVANRILRRRTACTTDTFSFTGGMDALVDALARTPGMHVRTGHRVQEVLPTDGGWRVTAAGAGGDRQIRARHVVLAAPAAAAARIVAPLDTELGRLLEGIHYAPLAVVHLGFDRAGVHHPLDGTGFLVPRAEGLPVSGNLWMSSLFPERAPPGKVLLATYVGGARTPQVAQWDNARVLDEALRALRPLLGLKAAPDMVHIDRHQQALPLYHGAYQSRLRAMASRLERFPGLHLEANYRGGVSVRDRIAQGRTTAKKIAAASPCHGPTAARPLGRRLVPEV